MLPKTDKKNSASNGDPEESNKPPEEDVNPEHMAWLSILVLIIATVLLLLLFGLLGGSWQGVIVELILANGALSVGGLIGFLFGIPRTALQKTPAAVAQATNNPATQQAPSFNYEPSTNLEQVSDWLTKILLGAGLVQLGAIPESLASVGGLVDKAFGGTTTGLGIVTQLVIITFLVIGFVTAYLWTRIHYSRLQTLRDSSTLDALNKVALKLKEETNELRKEAADTTKEIGLIASGVLATRSPTTTTLAAAEGEGAALAIGQSWPEELKEKLRRFYNEPDDWASDPIAKVFGTGPAESNGRKLTGRIIKDTPKGLFIELRVTPTTGAPPLNGEVTFVLHPTYIISVVNKAVENNQAQFRFYSGGEFTVAAIADEGKTVLLYSLQLLPGAPDWFMSR